MECKYYGTWIPLLVYTELIDTLWNVNTIGFDNGIIKMRINRYIMECK